jgi:peptide/nickel transport system ATP-binding protein
MSELRFEQVTVRYGTGAAALDAVAGVDLTVPSGSVVGLVGESGSGKSSLARAAVGLAPLTAGTIRLDGRDVTGRDADRRHPVQMVFQDPYSSLDPRMSIGASIAEAMQGVRGRSARGSEVARLLDLVSLDPGRAGLLPSALSGGQRQRVALARALAARPEVVIADEITSALDVSVQGAVLNLIRRIRRELGLSLLFISHNLAVVRYVSDVIAVMYLGRLVEVGPTEAVLADPQHPYTRSLLESAPRLGSRLMGSPLLGGRPAGAADDSELDVDIADPHDPPTGCRFHPRCPVGPRVLPLRGICVDVDPTVDAAARPHRAACHFPGATTTGQPITGQPITGQPISGPTTTPGAGPDTEEVSA